MKNTIKKIIEKGNYTKIKVVIAIILSILLGTFITIHSRNNIWDRIPVYSCIIMFAFLHLIIPIKNIYEFIYKKRYIIALVLLIYLVVMEYSGSSIGCYNNNIQPDDNSNKYYSPIFGKAQPIRSDEWNVNTPIAVSQVVDEENQFKYFNNNLRGTMTEMFSVASSPVLDILLLAKPFFIGYILLGASKGLAFMWYGKIIAMMLVSFELCMLLTNKKKVVSLLGMILITFSAATQWWNITEYIIWGGLALLLFDKFMTSTKYKIKIPCAIGIFISAISYIFILYPAWQLTYGYVFVPIFIWIIWKNRKVYKMNWKDILIILIVIIAIAGIGLRYYMMSKDVINAVSNTDYPGKRFELGGAGVSALFSYVYSFFFPYTSKVSNPCELSGMISIFPIPMLVAIIYMIRNKESKKHFSFLIPALIIGIFLSIWCLMPTNEFIAKVTFMYMVPGTRAVVPLGLLQILIMIYIMGNITEKDKIINNASIAKIFATVLSVIILSIAIRTDTENVLGNLKAYICGLALFIQIYSLLTINNKNSQNTLIAVLIPIAIATGAMVNPVQKGISVLLEKPVAKEVQKIVKEDKENNMWIAEYLPNYFLASGAKVINSVNTYPNFDLYKTILKDKADEEEYRKIYNRYAHIYVQIIEEESTIELVQADALRIKINPETIKELGIKYIVGSSQLESFSTENVQFERIYDELGMLIYKINY